MRAAIDRRAYHATDREVRGSPEPLSLEPIWNSEPGNLDDVVRRIIVELRHQAIVTMLNRQVRRSAIS